MGVADGAAAVVVGPAVLENVSGPAPSVSGGVEGAIAVGVRVAGTSEGMAIFGISRCGKPTSIPEARPSENNTGRNDSILAATVGYAKVCQRRLGRREPARQAKSAKPICTKGTRQKGEAKTRSARGKKQLQRETSWYISTRYVFPPGEVNGTNTWGRSRLTCGSESPSSLIKFGALQHELFETSNHGVAITRSRRPTWCIELRIERWRRLSRTVAAAQVQVGRTKHVRMDRLLFIRIKSSASATIQCNRPRLWAHGAELLADAVKQYSSEAVGVSCVEAEPNAGSFSRPAWCECGSDQRACASARDSKSVSNLQSALGRPQRQTSANLTSDCRAR